MKLMEVGKALDKSLYPRFISITNVAVNQTRFYHCSIMRVITVRLNAHTRLQLACYYDEFLHLNLISDLGSLSYLLDTALNMADVKKINDTYHSYMSLLGPAMVSPVFSLNDIMQTVKLYMHLFSYLLAETENETPLYNNQDH